MLAPHTVQVIAVCVFAGAASLSTGVIAMSIAPQWRRILRLALGNVERPRDAVARSSSAT